MRLFRSRSNNPRTYDLPIVDEVAAVIVGDFDGSDNGRDVLVSGQDGEFQRIHETHMSFIPLQYPLLFPYGEDGYQENIEYRNFGLHREIRKWKRNLNDCRIFGITKKIYEKDFLCGLQEAVYRGDVNPSMAGGRVVLPSSFIGGRKYMFNNCQDAMAICKRYGYPDLFLTMTCNPKLKEIKRFVEKKGLNVYDRPDITSRVFRIKLDQLMVDLKKGEYFGEVNAGMYTIEFQKRGLPHAHILLWLAHKDKLDFIEVIDSVVCAELPDPGKFPALFNVVSSYMVHGPCGASRMQSPCMNHGRCSNFFPKTFVEKTNFGSDGYPTYRRRNTGITTLRHGVELDNRFVVPYNPKLLMKYQAHINIEYCNMSNSIKYLFKYVNKGVDRVTVSISINSSSSTPVEQPVDETINLKLKYHGV